MLPHDRETKGLAQGEEAMKRRCASVMFVAPRHAQGGDWPWLSQIGSMQQLRIQPMYIENDCARFPKFTKPYIKLQHLRAIWRLRDADLAFLFSTSIARGLTAWPSRLVRQPRKIYVGFTQDGEWSAPKLARLTRALNHCDAVTVFSEDERQLYIKRYQLDPRRVHVIPIHTDEVDGYGKYAGEAPMKQPYVLSMGSPNRRFMPVAKACHELGVPLVIITRPNHQNDSLGELEDLGATVITNANKFTSLLYLKHARLATMVFQTPTLPGAFTTLVHAMYLQTPCVVSACLGMSDYVVDGETGFVTPHGNDHALQDAIARVWNDDSLRERFACRGIERAMRLHSLNAAAEQFSALADQVLQCANRAKTQAAAASQAGQPVPD